MLPPRSDARQSGIVSRRAAAIAAEVRIPSLGRSFVAHALGIRPDGIALATFHVLEPGTRVEIELSLPDGHASIDGVIAAGPDGGLAIDLVDIDDSMRMRLASVAAFSRVA